MTTRRNGFEGQTNGTTVTTLNSANSGDAFTNVNINGGSIVYSTTRAMTGTVSLLITPNGAASCYVDDATFNSTQLVTSFCFYYTGLPSAAVTIFQARTAAGGSFGMNISTAGKLTSTDSAGATVNLATTALTAGHWYRIEMQGLSDATAGTVAYQYFLDNAGSAVESLSSSSKNTRGGNITTARYGSPTTSTGFASYTFDNLQAQDATGTALGAWGVPPVAAFTSLSINGLVLSVNGSASSFTAPATSLTYDWNWGDATAHGTGSSTTHTYSAGGTYTVTLTVTDNNSLTGTPVTYSVQVAAAASTVGAGIAVPASGWALTPSSGATFQAILNDADGTTFGTSTSNPTAATQWIPLQKVLYTTGQGFSVPLALDRITGTSGTVDVTLKEGAASDGTGGTVRAAVTALAVATGTNGSAVTNVVTANFLASDCANVVDWGNVGVLLSLTGS